MDLADTASYESIHRKFTVAAWGKTSKRLESMNEEMAAQCLLMNYNPFNEFIHAVSTDTMAKYIATRGPVTAPDHIVLRSLPNLKSYELSVGLVTLHIEGPAQYVDMLDSAGTTAETLTNLVRQSFGQAAWDTLQRIHHPTSLRILHGLTIEGNKESKLGKICLYATNNFRNRRCKYDHVIIQLDQGVTQPAQLMVLLQLSNASKSHKQFSL
jgi:hypothetical protein